MRYALINRISVRYGSSAQYFWSSAQMYLQNLMDCENSNKTDAVPALGGAALAGTACGGATAYVYLKLPHNSIRAQGKPPTLSLRPFGATYRYNCGVVLPREHHDQSGW